MKVICRSGRLARVLAVGACLVLSACGGAGARFSSHLQRGKDYLAAGNLDKAGVEFRNAAQIQPKNPLGLYYSGRVAEARGDIRYAIGFYRAAMDADPGNVDARAALGKMLVFAGAAKNAFDVVAPALVAHPDNADLLAVRAAAHHQMKQTTEALADAEHAVRVSPVNENAIAVLAGLYAETKDYPKAISLVTSALEKVPASVDLRGVLTSLYLATDQPALAEEQMRKVIALKPLELSPRAQLATFLSRRHDLDGAQRVLEDAVAALSASKQDSKSDNAKLMLVNFIVAQRSRAEGEKALRDFIARSPDNLDLRLGLGTLLQRTGAPSDAIVAYQDVIKRDGTGAKGLMARNRIAAIEVGEGHGDAARKLIDEVLIKSPRDDDALILRATLEMSQNDAADAIGDLRAVLRDQPNNIPLQRSLARAYVNKGEPALAEEALRAAMQTSPNDVGVRVDLADILGNTNRAAEGLTLLKETVARQPDSLPAREALIKADVAHNDTAAARGVAEDLKASQPKSSVGFYYAGLIAAQDRKFDESQKNLEQALERQPGDAQILGALARVDVARGSYDNAIRPVQAALEQAPRSIALLDLLGELYFGKKDFANAAEIFAREISLEPQRWQSHGDLARVKLAVNDLDGAVREFQTALKIAPTEPGLVADAASLYEKQGRIDDAIQGYEALYKGNPRSRQFAANNLAMLLVTYKTDRASLDRARDLTSAFAASDNGDMLDTVGWVRFKRGEVRDALSPLQRASERVPGSRVIRYHLGMTQLQLGLRDEARSNLEVAVSGTDNFQGAAEARAVLAGLKVRA